MDIDALRDLAADIGNLLRLIDRLGPLVEAYGRPPESVAALVAAPEPVREPEPPAPARACESCGTPFTPSARVGGRQRYCSRACRIKESTARQACRQKAAPGDDDAPAPEDSPTPPIGRPAPLAAGFSGDPVERPERALRVPIEDDPDRAMHLRPPPTGIAAIDNGAA